MSGKRYDDPKATPEYIATEKARKRLANRRGWVNLWWPRIQETTKSEKEVKTDDR